MTIQSPDYFKLDGVSSEKYGLYVDTPPMPPLAQRNSTSINYIANHENFVYLQDYYNNISITLNCYFFEPPENISALYSWLATGKKLETSRFHDFYYKIKSLKGITPKYRGFGNYALNITFECSPYRYKDNNLKFDCDDAFLQNGLSVMNYGSIPSFPLITIAVADADCIKMIDENSLQNATEEKANVLYVNHQKFGFFVVVALIATIKLLIAEKMVKPCLQLENILNLRLETTTLKQKVQKSAIFGNLKMRKDIYDTTYRS